MSKMKIFRMNLFSKIKMIKVMIITWMKLLNNKNKIEMLKLETLNNKNLTTHNSYSSYNRMSSKN